eukprot:scaffold8679_cov19-Tisochrysis_lutea.AAC.4
MAPCIQERFLTCKLARVSPKTAAVQPAHAVVQCFPDAFHLDTLGVLLNALPELQPGVKAVEHCVISLAVKAAQQGECKQNAGVRSAGVKLPCPGREVPA